MTRTFALLVAGYALSACSVEAESPEPKGRFQTDQIVQIDLTMAADDWQALTQQSRSFITEFSGDCRAEPFSKPYTYFHGQITMDGESLPDIGIRKKGFIGSQSTTKPSFRINLDEYVEGAELFGKDNLTLNNSVQDPSLVRQCLAYDLFNQAGIAAPRCNFARVSMNGEDLGIYVHVEPIKPSFLRDHFGESDGDLYEGTVSDFRDDWYRTYEVKTLTTDSAYGPITELMRDIAPGQDKEEALRAHFDFDELLTFLAMENIVGHWDGYAGNRNNHYIYRDSITSKLHFIPWGADGVMLAERIEEVPYYKGIIAHHILGDRDLSAQLSSRTNELLETLWNEETLLAEIDRMTALIETEIEIDRVISAGLDNLREYINRRAQALQGALPGENQQLEPAFCLEKKGEIDAQFTTTWESLGTNPDITRLGELDWSMEWENQRMPFVNDGVAAGYNDQNVPMLVLVGIFEDESMFIPYLSFDPDAVREGQEMPINVMGQRGTEAEATGAVLYRGRITGGQIVPAGSMSGGHVVFDRFENRRGGAVRGRMITDLYGWEDQ
jgi:hypothetical protein